MEDKKSQEPLSANKDNNNKLLKRVKVTNACALCRRKKIKCDGISPCSNCKRVGVTCHIENVTRKRGPHKPRPSTSSAQSTPSDSYSQDQRQDWGNRGESSTISAYTSQTSSAGTSHQDGAGNNHPTPPPGTGSVQQQQKQKSAVPVPIQQQSQQSQQSQPQQPHQLPTYTGRRPEDYSDYNNQHHHFLSYPPPYHHQNHPTPHQMLPHPSAPIQPQHHHHYQSHYPPNIQQHPGPPGPPPQQYDYQHPPQSSTQQHLQQLQPPPSIPIPPIQHSSSMRPPYDPHFYHQYYSNIPPGSVHHYDYQQQYNESKLPYTMIQNKDERSITIDGHDLRYGKNQSEFLPTSNNSILLPSKTGLILRECPKNFDEVYSLAMSWSRDKPEIRSRLHTLYREKTHIEHTFSEEKTHTITKSELHRVIENIPENVQMMLLDPYFITQRYIATPILNEVIFRAQMRSSDISTQPDPTIKWAVLSIGAQCSKRPEVFNFFATKFDDAVHEPQKLAAQYFFLKAKESFCKVINSPPYSIITIQGALLMFICYSAFQRFEQALIYVGIAGHMCLCLRHHIERYIPKSPPLWKQQDARRGLWVALYGIFIFQIALKVKPVIEFGMVTSDTPTLDDGEMDEPSRGLPIPSFTDCSFSSSVKTFYSFMDRFKKASQVIDKQMHSIMNSKTNLTLSEIQDMQKTLESDTPMTQINDTNMQSLLSNLYHHLCILIFNQYYIPDLPFDENNGLERDIMIETISSRKKTKIQNTDPNLTEPIRIECRKKCSDAARSITRVLSHMFDLGLKENVYDMHIHPIGAAAEAAITHLYDAIYPLNNDKDEEAIDYLIESLKLAHRSKLIALQSPVVELEE